MNSTYFTRLTLSEFEERVFELFKEGSEMSAQQIVKGLHLDSWPKNNEISTATTALVDKYGLLVPIKNKGYADVAWHISERGQQFLNWRESQELRLRESENAQVARQRYLDQQLIDSQRAYDRAQKQERKNRKIAIMATIISGLTLLLELVKFLIS